MKSYGVTIGSYQAETCLGTFIMLYKVTSFRVRMQFSKSDQCLKYCTDISCDAVCWLVGLLFTVVFLHALKTQKY